MQHEKTYRRAMANTYECFCAVKAFNSVPSICVYLYAQHTYGILRRTTGRGSITSMSKEEPRKYN